MAATKITIEWGYDLDEYPQLPALMTISVTMLANNEAEVMDYLKKIGFTVLTGCVRVGEFDSKIIYWSDSGQQRR